MTAPTPEEYEAKLAVEAEQLRGDADKLTPALFRQLWPLLCEPIHAGHIVVAPPVTGKPYASTGIRSVQVQVDRMNNVLTPLWWWDDAEYADGGRLCTVTVYVGSPSEGVLIHRKSSGGVERASSTGNLYKGSYTNAAKVAFARLGPGHEVYIGLLDPDPDVGGEEAAPEGIGEDLARTLWQRTSELGLLDRLRLSLARVLEKDVGDVTDEKVAVQAMAVLTHQQAAALEDWLSKKADEKAAKEEK